MIAARVAGVPSPLSFIAARSSSSSTNLPAFSIAESKVASVWRVGGLVFLASVAKLPASRSPSANGGNGAAVSSSSSSLRFPFLPGLPPESSSSP